MAMGADERGGGWDAGAAASAVDQLGALLFARRLGCAGARGDAYGDGGMERAYEMCVGGMRGIGGSPGGGPPIDRC